jgi:hypothetical protein
MQIKTDSALEQKLSARPNATEGLPVYGDDASFFSSQLERPTRVQPSSPSHAPSNLLVDASNALLKSNELMTKGLRAFSKGNNEKQTLLYGSHLSNSVLMTQILVKSVSKSAQLVEKMSNLQ